MNKIQKAISIVGVLLILLMSLFPPWRYSYGDSITYRSVPAGYHLIFSPPRPDEEEILGIELDLSRLAVQWITLLFVMGAAIYLTQDKEEQPDTDDDEDVFPDV